MTSMVGALLGAAVKGGLLAAVARVVEWRRPAAHRHLLWSLVIVGHLVLLASAPLAPVWRLPADRVPEAVAGFLGSVDRTGPVRGQTFDATDTGATAAAVRELPGDGPGTTAPSSMRTFGTTVAPSRLLVWLWAGVTLLLLLRALVHVVAGRRCVTRSVRCHTSKWWGDVDRACAELGIERSVDVRYLAGLRTPMISGVFRTVLLLPHRARSWSSERRRTVALHELAHVARRDGMWRCLAHAVRALFWFDPFVWYAFGRVSAEAESACDEIAVRLGPGAQRYVEELVEIVREARGRSAPGLASSLGRRRGLEGRARRLSRSGSRTRGGMRQRPVIPSVAGGFAVILILAGTRLSGGGPAVEGMTVEDEVSRADLVPETGAEPPSGCAYDGGFHRDVHRSTQSGKAVWLVGWDGPGCRVRFEARGAYTVTEDRGLVPAAGGTLEVTVDGVRLTRELSMRSSDRGRDLEMRLDGRGVDDGQRRELLAWNAAFAGELARHTGYDAPRRVRELLAGGGVAAVLSETARRTSGGHAAGVYLRELVRSHELTSEGVRRVLTVARDEVANEAAMSSLLAAVAARYPVEGQGLRKYYVDAAGSLETRAGRATALAALDP